MSIINTITNEDCVDERVNLVMMIGYYLSLIASFTNG